MRNLRSYQLYGFLLVLFVTAETIRFSHLALHHEYSENMADLVINTKTNRTCSLFHYINWYPGIFIETTITKYLPVVTLQINKAKTFRKKSATILYLFLRGPPIAGYI